MKHKHMRLSRPACILQDGLRRKVVVVDVTTAYLHPTCVHRVQKQLLAEALVSGDKCSKLFFSVCADRHGVEDDLDDLSIRRTKRHRLEVLNHFACGWSL